LLWRWSPLIAFAVLAGFATWKLGAGDVFGPAVVTALFLGAWPMIEFFVLLHEFGHLLAFWIFRPEGPHPAFMVIGKSDRATEYTFLFRLWKTEIRLGCGIWGWIEEPPMEHEPGWFIRIAAIGGYLIGSCAGYAFLCASPDPSHHQPGLIRALLEIARYVALILVFAPWLEILLLGWFSEGTDTRIFVLGKFEYLRAIAKRKK
jgi:hypothetical protein